jgi:hypothetical protein
MKSTRGPKKDLYERLRMPSDSFTQNPLVNNEINPQFKKE